MSDDATTCPVCRAAVTLDDDGKVAPHTDPNGFFPGECFGTGTESERAA